MSMDIQKPKKDMFVTTEVFERKFQLFEDRFEEAMTSIARSFDMLIQMRQEDLGWFRQWTKTIDDHSIHISKHERSLDNLTERIEIIENK